jgi:hypothetical protein
MDNIDDFYSIINRKDDVYEKNSIYDEMKQKEDLYYNTINNVIRHKENEKELDPSLFVQNQTMVSFLTSMFIELLGLFNEALTGKIDVASIIQGRRSVYVGSLIVWLVILKLAIDSE